MFQIASYKYFVLEVVYGMIHSQLLEVHRVHVVVSSTFKNNCIINQSNILKKKINRQSCRNSVHDWSERRRKMRWLLYYHDANNNNNNDANNNNNYYYWTLSLSIPTTGFSIGSLCNRNENMCIIGSECKKVNWYDWSTVCSNSQPPSLSLSSSLSMSSKIDNTNNYNATTDTNTSTISSSSSRSTYGASSSASSSQNGSSSFFFFYLSSLSWIMMLSVS